MLFDIILYAVYGTSLFFSIFLLLIYLDHKRSHKKELEKYPEVSIIIPAYNEEDTIKQTLESVAKMDYPEYSLDVYIVNDGSTDKTKSVIEKFIKNKANFSLVSHDNMGKAASMNKVLNMINTPYFLCLDADSYVEPNSLKEIMTHFLTNDTGNLAIVTPAMKVWSPKNWLQKIQRFEYIVMLLFARLASHMDSLYVAPGPFSVYKTKVIKELGGFNTTTLTEDQEIAYRVQEHHYQIKHCPTAHVYTVSPRTLKAFYLQRRRWYMGGMQCSAQYKHLIAKKEYGDFGVFQVTKTVASYFLVGIGLLFAGYMASKPLYEQIRRGFLVNFDIWPYLQSLQFTVNPLFINPLKGIVLGSIFMIGIFFFIKAHKLTNEKVSGHGYFALVPYFVAYYLIKGTILCYCAIQILQKKRIKW